jgi:hypothetical protein
MHTRGSIGSVAPAAALITVRAPSQNRVSRATRFISDWRACAHSCTSHTACNMPTSPPLYTVSCTGVHQCHACVLQQKRRRLLTRWLPGCSYTRKQCIWRKSTHVHRTVHTVLVISAAATTENVSLLCTQEGNAHCPHGAARTKEAAASSSPPTICTTPLHKGSYHSGATVHLPLAPLQRISALCALLITAATLALTTAPRERATQR